MGLISDITDISTNTQNSKPYTAPNPKTFSPNPKPKTPNRGKELEASLQEITLSRNASQSEVPLLNLRTTTSQKCEAVPRRVRF